MNAVANKANDIDDLSSADSIEESLHDDSSACHCQLSVLTGVQQGAIATQPGTGSFTIGADLTDDIVLRDSSVAPNRALVKIQECVITIGCLSGELTVDGVLVQANSEAVHSGLVIIQLGDVAVSLQSELSDESILSIESNDAIPAKACDQFAMQVDTHKIHPEAKPIGSAELLAANLSETSKSTFGLRSQVSNTKAIWSSALALVLGATVVWQSGLFSSPAVDTFSLEQSLATLSLPDLLIEQEDRTVTVSGYVDTYQAFIQLNQKLEQSGLLIDNSVLVGEVVSEHVLDVFRVHGVSATVEVSHDDNAVSATVATQEADVDLLATIEERVMRDVPGIGSMSIENIPPELPESEKSIPVDPGKRVAMVISDIPAHVVTEDQSRYFIGSLLPTGHRIDSIEDGKVMLSKDGASTVLQF